MKIKYTLLALLYSLFFHSQENNILPPSPEAAQLGKYIETPVSVTNGVPEINIPFFSFNENDIQVPVNLSYHAGGIKVEEIASNVGLGWTLNIGGAISRVMRDRPDDYSSEKGFLYNKVIPYSSSNPHLVYNKIADGTDVEADIFTFSFMGISGKFAFDQSSGKFVQFPLSDIKIEPVYNSNFIYGFIITTVDGFKYYFGQNKSKNILAVNKYESILSYLQDETGFSIFSSSEDMPYINTWHLTEIVSPKGNIVTFSYDMTLSSQYLLRNNQEISYSDSKQSIRNLYPKTTYTFFTNTDVHLKSVLGKNGKIIIEYDTSYREDLQGKKRISEVKLQTLSGDYTSYRFFHTYFTSPNFNDNFVNGFGGAHYTKRLKLDYIQKNHTKNGIVLSDGKYTFTYNNIPLPNRFSYDQDYWGYYNGSNNPSLIPQYYLSPSFIINPVTGNAKRSVNPDFTQAGILQKIQYPTGGFVEYTYENNTVGHIPFIDNDRENNLKNYTVNNHFVFVKSNNTQAGENIYEATFNIKNIVGQVSINLVNPNCGINMGFHCGFLINVQGVNNAVNIDLSTDNIKNYSLPNGAYKIRAEALGTDNSSDQDFSVTLNWDEETDTNNIYVGGVRIKKILLNDSSSTIEKQYSYESDNLVLGSTNRYLSSGISVTAPLLRSDAVNGQHVYDKISSYSNYPTINIGRNDMHYGKVTEIINNDVKTEYYFDSVGDLNSDISGEGIFCGFIGSGGAADGYLTKYFKHKKEPYYSDRRGKLLVKKEYKFSGGYFSLVKQDTNIYTESREYIMPNYSIRYEKGSSSDNNTCIPIRFYRYPQRTNFTYLSKKTSVLYLNNSVQTIKNYFYNNPSHYQPTTQATIFPDNSTSTITYSYAHEKGNQYLIGKNMVGIPLQTTVTKKSGVGDPGKIISSTETKYPTSQADADQRTSGLPVPYEVLSKDLQGATMEREVSYDKYDNKGNLLQFTSKAGAPTAIIYGYNQTLPIAKVEGATYTQTSGLIADIIAKSDADTDVALLTALDAFRNHAALSGYQITTYTHDPLIGITSITPPSGIREIYKYDTANRLEKVVDVNGNILKEYKYNHKQ